MTYLYTSFFSSHSSYLYHVDHMQPLYQSTLYEVLSIRYMQYTYYYQYDHNQMKDKDDSLDFGDESVQGNSIPL